MQARTLLAVLGLAVYQPTSAIPSYYAIGSQFLDAIASPTLESFESTDTSSRNTAPIVTPNFTMTIAPISAGSYNWRVTDESRPSAGTVATDGSRFVEAGGGLASGGAAFSITFSFLNPISAFGISILDFGDVGTSGYVGIDDGLGNSFLVAENPLPFSNGSRLFAGLIAPANGMSAITITKTTMTDGIALDEIYFTAAVPAGEPTVLPLVLLAMFAALGFQWTKAGIKAAANKHMESDA